MDDRSQATGLIGRGDLLGRLGTVISSSAPRGVVLVVEGQGGIGKTSLVGEATTQARRDGVRVGWGTCVDGAAVPGYWPWTQALNALARSTGLSAAVAAAGAERALVSIVVTAMAVEQEPSTFDGAALLVWDAVVRWLGALAQEGQVLAVLDDLQWADDSSLALLEFIATSCEVPHVCVIGMLRPDELSVTARMRVNGVVGHASHLRVQGLDGPAIHLLVERVVGFSVDPLVSAEIHRRSGGHPFFARELALDSVSGAGSDSVVPGAVREVVERRLARLAPDTLQVLRIAAIVGNEIAVDVVAGALGRTAADVRVALVEAIAAGVVVTDDGTDRITHDLLRETLVAGLDPAQTIAAHQAVAEALEARADRTGVSNPAEIARHFADAIGSDGPIRAARWALAAARADSVALAFPEAARHLRRFRTCAQEDGVSVPDDTMVDVLLAEADAVARNGSPLEARGLLRAARDLSMRSGDVRRTAHVAIAASQLGSQFSARRDDLVAELETAIDLVAGVDQTLEARLTATLARELQHSVAEQRPRAGPLTERALDLGRRAGDPETLLTCLVARHDALWTPGTAPDRADLACEIVRVARAARLVEHEAEGLLLLANAELERGSGSFLAALENCLALLQQLGQPRHRYTTLTRRAAVAMLHGDLDEATLLVDAATELGLRIREPDTENVRMSQRLELVRASNDPDQLRAFANDAVTHWIGAPVHAHSVAAGFCARAGDLSSARAHLATVQDLGSWHTDRSYLWSVFIRELARAAIALEDRDLCAQLLDEVLPLAGTCGVNGAVVAFAGCHAHTAGLLAGALDRPGASVHHDQAHETYIRLGARNWSDELERDRVGASDLASTTSSFRRAGPLWHVTYHGMHASIPHSKGLADLAVLLAKPGSDVSALVLAGNQQPPAQGGTITDRTALAAYRKRLRDLDDDLDESIRHHDIARTEHLTAERTAILDELRRSTTSTGQPREFSNRPAERARKAVSARIRAAIDTITTALPELGDHLDRTVITGTHCRYTLAPHNCWDVDPRGPDG